MKAIYSKDLAKEGSSSCFCPQEGEVLATEGPLCP